MSRHWLRHAESEALLGTAVWRYQNLGALRACTRDDLLQEGRLALLRAQRTFDPAVGVPPKHYAWRALVLALGTYVAHESSPVSGASARAGRPNRGVRVELAHDRDDSSATAGHAYVAIDARSHAEAYEDAQWNACVRSRLRALAEADDGAVRVALGLETAQESAQHTARPTREVYKATCRLRQKAVQDVVLWKLLKEKEER